MFTLEDGYSLQAHELQPGNIYRSAFGNVFYLIEMQIVEGKFFEKRNGFSYLKAIRLNKKRIEEDEIWPPETPRRFKCLTPT